MNAFEVVFRRISGGDIERLVLGAQKRLGICWTLRVG